MAGELKSHKALTEERHDNIKEALGELTSEVKGLRADLRQAPREN